MGCNRLCTAEDREAADLARSSNMSFREAKAQLHSEKIQAAFDQLAESGLAQEAARQAVVDREHAQKAAAQAVTQINQPSGGGLSPSFSSGATALSMFQHGYEPIAFNPSATSGVGSVWYKDGGYVAVSASSSGFGTSDVGSAVAAALGCDRLAVDRIASSISSYVPPPAEEAYRTWSDRAREATGGSGPAYIDDRGVFASAAGAAELRWGGDVAAQVLREFAEAQGMVVDRAADYSAWADDVRDSPHIRESTSAAPAAILGSEMERAGMPCPGAGYEAHHLVPEGDPRAERARQFLEARGISVNDADNGAWLPRGPGTPNPDAMTRHEFTFPGSYFQSLNDILFRNPDATEAEVRQTLRDLRDFLQDEAGARFS